MMFVIWHPKKRQYVAKPGMARSFTSRLHRAVTYETRTMAESNKCGDEIVTEVIGV